MHRCYACDLDHAESSYNHDAATVRVPPRFAGPPGSANGGLAVGLLACPALRAAPGGSRVSRISARLHRPLPLDRDLRVETQLEGAVARVALVGDDGPAITGDLELRAAHDAAPPLPGAVTGHVAALAATPVPDAPPFWEVTGEHPIAGCFSCGPEHPRGLGIFPRAVADGVVCAPWTTGGEFARDGVIATSVVTSAIDCSSGICMPLDMQRELLDLDQFFLLGSLDVRYLRDAPPDRAYRVAAKALRRDGRKFFGLSVLADDGGIAYATAEATWIVAGVSRTQAFRAPAN